MNPTIINKYRLGYNECANEVTRYLGNVEGVGVDSRARLLRHLTTCLGENKRTPRQPIRMQSLLRSNSSSNTSNHTNNNNNNNNSNNNNNGNNNSNTNNMATVVPIMTTGGVLLQNGHLTRNVSNVLHSNNMLQTAKLVDSNGSEMTVLIGLPNAAVTQNHLMTSQSQFTSNGEAVFHVVPMVTQKTTLPLQPNSVNAPMTSQRSHYLLTSGTLSNSSIITSQSTVDGKEKTYEEVGVWQDDVWRPW